MSLLDDDYYTREVALLGPDAGPAWLPPEPAYVPPKAPDWWAQYMRDFDASGGTIAAPKQLGLTGTDRTDWAGVYATNAAESYAAAGQAVASVAGGALSSLKWVAWLAIAAAVIYVVSVAKPFIPTPAPRGRRQRKAA